ncbi:MAG: serine/threonine-protein kinase [Pseudomonadota bacterium]
MTLSSTQWPRAKEILADALELDPSERAAFVAAQCAGAPELLAEVQSLLGHASGLTAFGDQQAQFGRDAAADSGERDFSGHRAGAYVLMEAIGQGGMGVVYAAERADGAYQQKVAVKLLKGNLGTDMDARRMARERQALAALNHPNIARLLDGGSTADGMPYLVMELVEGVPIDAYCELKQLGVHARVSLMVAVCAAVQAAHQQLLIHRDIKPSNILVTSSGIPKLLDFGVARLMESEGGAELTRDAALLFTPRYASPEQVRGLPVSVATDVHGLGLLLYDLLAGSSPYERLGSATASSAADAIRAVLEDSPKKASQIAARAAPQRARALVGELDTILLKACAKEAAGRYATVAELAADLQRWLDGKPIRARPHSWHYVARKFIGRHQVGTALGLAAVLAIGAGIGGTIQQKNEAVRQQQIAATRAAQVRQFANEMIFTYYDAMETLTGSLSVRKKLVQDALRYLDTLGTSEISDPALATELAEGYRKLAHLMYNGVNLPHLGDEAGAARARAKAMALLDAALARHPDNKGASASWAETNSDIAALLGIEGKTAEAITRLQASAVRYGAIVKQYPDDSVMHYELIKMHLRTAQAALNGKQPSRQYLDLAEKEFKLWAPKNPANLERLNMHAYLVRTQQREAGVVKDMPRVFALIEQEIALLEAMMVKEPDNDTLRLQKANALQTYGGHKSRSRDEKVGLEYLKKAAIILNDLAARDASDKLAVSSLARNYTFQGDCHRLLDNKAAALEAYRTSARAFDSALQGDAQIHIIRNGSEAYYRLALGLQAQGDQAGARAEAQRLIKLAEKRPEAFASGSHAEWLAEARKIAG